MTKNSMIRERYDSTQEEKDSYDNPAFLATDLDHVPYNKRAGEVEQSRCRLVVQDYNGRKPQANPNAWTEIQLEEVVKHHSGVYRTYVISITLDADQRALLRRYLDETENRSW